MECALLLAPAQVHFVKFTNRNCLSDPICQEMQEDVQRHSVDVHTVLRLCEVSLKYANTSLIDQYFKNA